MQVFKTFLKIAKKKLPSAFIYIGIFLGISLIMAMNSNSNTEFKETKLDVCIIDEDNSDASKALTDYIKETNNIVELKNDKDVILDAIYYERVDYVLTIKDGYENKLSKGETENLFTNYKIPNSYTATFFDNEIDEYVATASAYVTGGSELSAALESTDKALSQEVSVTKETFKSADTNNEYQESFSLFFQYLPYIFLSVLITALCPVLLIMNEKEIRNRTNCSSVTSTSHTLQIFLGSSLFVFGTWIVFMITAFFFNKCKLNSTVMLAVLNSFIFMLVAAGIALLIAAFSPNRKAVDMIANVVGLGMSFLCGIFVPQYMLGDGVLKAARFLPAYWYVKVNNMLAGRSGEIYSLGKYLKYVGIEAAFAVALFALVMLVSKLKRRAA